MKIEDLLSAGGMSAAINPQVYTMDRIASPEGVRRVFCSSPTKTIQNNSENDTIALGPATSHASSVSAPTRMFCLSPKNIMPASFSAPSISTEKVGTTQISESCSPSEKENSPAEEKLQFTQNSTDSGNKSIRRYVHSKAPPAKNLKVGRWTKLEHQKFLEGMENFPKQWKRIADLIGTRTVLQVRTHAQKFFQSTKMAGNSNARGETAGKPQKRKPTSSKPKTQKRAKTNSYSYMNMNISVQHQSTDFYQPHKKFSPVQSDDHVMVAEVMIEHPRAIACRAERTDGVHSRNSVDAVAALLSLGA